MSKGLEEYGDLAICLLVARRRMGDYCVRYSRDYRCVMKLKVLLLAFRW